MGRISGIYGLLLWFTAGCLCSGWAYGQSPFNPEFRETASGITEHLELFSDRSIYIAGEEILFRADYRLEDADRIGPWSSILHLELVGPAGLSVVEGKYSIMNGIACGSVPVPAGILTGDYHLKGYTRWMRNRGPSGFSYLPLKIINPGKDGVANPVREQAADSLFPRVVLEGSGFLITTGGDTFRAGEEIRIHLGLQKDFPREQLRCCVTVVPAGTVDTSAGQYKIPDAANAGSGFTVNYLPDLGPGVSLSGSVVDVDQAPVPYAKVYFSILSGSRDFYAVTADKQGRFIMSLKNGTGIQELFVTPEPVETGAPVVRIDQEFDDRSVVLPAGPFRISADQKEAARRLALKKQVGDEFEGDMPETTDDSLAPATGGEGPPFYGTSVNRLMMDDYVRLPNLEEVFINLMPELQFYKRRGNTMLRIFSQNNSIEVYDPLVLIDDVPVFHLETLMPISPEKIEWIDLINDPYLKGSMVIGGVLAIHSRNRDLAGIDLPEGGYFFDLQSIRSPAYSRRPAFPADKRKPDTRNTLLWLSDVVVGKNNPVELSLAAPGFPGEYVILVRSVTPGGEVLGSSRTFKVE